MAKPLPTLVRFRSGWFLWGYAEFDAVYNGYRVVELPFNALPTKGLSV